MRRVDDPGFGWDRELVVGLHDRVLAGRDDLGAGPPRVANALWDAFFDRDVTAGYYRSVSDVSAATATKDLAGATSARLLKPIGRRRGRRYQPTEALYRAVGGALLIEVSGPADVARAGIVAELSRRATWTGKLGEREAGKG